MLPEQTALGELRPREVFIDFDGPRLFSCVSTSGQLFLAIHVAETDEHDTWLYAPITANAIGRLKKGDVSIRTAFVRNRAGYVFIVKMTRKSKTWTADVVSVANIPNEFLPDPAEYLAEERKESFEVPAELFHIDKKEHVVAPSMFRGTVWDSGAGRIWELDQDVIRFFREIKTPVEKAAKLGGNVVVDVRLFRTLSDSRTDVPTHTLGRVLSQTQGLVDACGEARLDRPKGSGPIKIEVREQTRLVAEAVFPGSFGIRLEGEERLLDIDPRVSATFREFVRLLDASADLARARFLLSDLGPRVAVSLKALVRTLKKERLNLVVELGLPGQSKPSKGQILRKDLNAFLRLLNRVTSSRADTIDIQGVLVAANMATRFFSIETADTVFSGRIADQCLPKVDHQRINARHRATLDVYVEINETSGDAEEKYMLVDLISLE